MGNNWPKPSLAGAPVQIIDGDRGIHYPKQNDLHKAGYCLFLDAGNVTNDGFNLSECVFIDAEKDAALGKGKLNRYDIVLTTRGTVGNVAFYDASIPYENIRINSGMVILRPDSGQILPRFLYMFLRSSSFENQVKAFLTGSAQPQLPIRDIVKIQLPLPPFPEQRAIVSVLGPLDDNINLLHRQNETLESIAQALFKHWFVGFEFPDENGRPYKSSGGGMVPDEEFGEMPDKWGVGKIEDFGEVVCGKTPSKSVDEYYNGEIHFIKIPDMHGNVFVIDTEDKLSEKGSDSQTSKYLPPHSINVSCIATVGLVTINSKAAHTNQQINSIIPRDNSYLEYLYFSMKKLSGDLTALGSGGSATLNVNTNTFANLETIKPRETVIKQFHEISFVLFEKIESNYYEIKKLQKVRDALLTKLVSGKIRVTL